ncbi:uncharacterized protein LOC119786846 [Cyprinodon tularosa]|uniref:uncharacterized protein LOC119786846 n=1 Tax=Cyprinodon tularosa TaxID=77115 RepID=UPI0018E24D5A|nr:uncharacterized protein LOC119786846 [Cyprinodon tularosa]
MKRQGGTIYNYFKRNRSGLEQISSPGSPHPGTSQESPAESSLSSSPGVRVDRDDDRSQAGTITEECQAQHSPPSSVPSEEGSEASEQDDDPDPEQPEPEDVSSTAFAPSKGPSDISTSREEVPVQPHLSKYPKTLHGTSKRAFNSKWYTNNSWLEYSVSKNSCYCFACRHFSLPNAPDFAFTSDVGFSNWKKALSKEAGFKLHSRS